MDNQKLGRYRTVLAAQLCFGVLLLLLLMSGLPRGVPTVALTCWLIVQATVLLWLRWQKRQRARLARQERKHMVSSQNVEQIFGNIEQFLQEIQDTEDGRIRSQILRTQAELYSLQRQINPHFLYNTLETIRGLALRKGEQDIAKMTELLGRFFRYSIGTNDQFVTLEDELKNIDNYVAIQNYRFHGKIHLKMQLQEDDERLHTYRVPFLILQPLIENAIHHGLETKVGDGTILLRIVATENQLMIRVSDDGVGIGFQELEEINWRIRMPEQRTYPKSGRYTGIALVNIHQRVQLIYGSSYGLRVMSEKGIGTTAELTLPREKEQGGSTRQEQICLRNIHKEAAGIVALDSVDLLLIRGQRMNVIGPSGCGKHTLARVLSGQLAPDSGTYTCAGRPVKTHSVQQMHDRGVFLVDETSCLADDLTVGENLVLQKMTQLGGFAFRETAHIQAKQVCRSFDFHMDVYRLASSLSTEERILLEIYRAVFLKANVLVLYHVLPFLSPERQRMLSKQLNTWQADGLSVLSFDLWMNTFTGTCDRVLFMKRGRIAMEFDRNEYSLESAERLMKQWLQPDYPVKERRRDRGGVDAPTVLELVGWQAEKQKEPITLTLHRGAAIGLCGDRERCHALALELAGRSANSTAQVYLEGRTATSKKLMEEVGYINRELLQNGFFPNMTVMQNFLLYSMIRKGRKRWVTPAYKQFILEQFSGMLGLERAAWFSPAGQLSKNEKVKLGLYRWIASGCKVLVMDAPFDHGNYLVNNEILNFIDMASRGGISILLTCDQEEMMQNVCQSLVFV